MNKLVQILIGLAILTFAIGAVGVVFPIPILNIMPEGFSRASNNLALIAIALSVCCKKECSTAQ